MTDTKGETSSNLDHELELQPLKTQSMEAESEHTFEVRFHDFFEEPFHIFCVDVKDGVISVLAFEYQQDDKVCVNALMVQKGLAEFTSIHDLT